MTKSTPGGVSSRHHQVSAAVRERHRPHSWREFRLDIGLSVFRFVRPETARELLATELLPFLALNLERDILRVIQNLPHCFVRKLLDDFSKRLSRVHKCSRFEPAIVPSR